MKFIVPSDRLATLHARRDLKMARSAHAYVRGNTLLFYRWLTEEGGDRIVPEGPAVWICGDCHLGNLGPISNGGGKVAIQIRDLDQAVIGNPAHDLIRLGLSLATAARGSDLPGVVTARMMEEMVDGYEQAFVGPENGEEDGDGEPDIVRVVRRRAVGRKWRHLAKERLDDVEPRIPLGRRFWPLSEEEATGLREIVTHRPVSRMILSLDSKGEERRPVMVDAAYWMKGCSSLGLMRYAAIVALDGERGTDHALVDIKEAIEPIAPAAEDAQMPQDPAERVLAAARALSPYLGGRMATARLHGHSLFVRELMPQDLKIEVEQFSRAEALKSARYLAWVVGKAHARQMDPATRRSWARTLQRGRSGGLDAPSWLWRTVVDLAGRHERGYLEHCRVHALGA
ncbi:MULTISPECIES: DUF2252 family protein [Novosphingobium]|uniref:DUF2252 domain-containing protein n=3 Tax=Sphingomonadaceae TaxID=41297 RepID=A0A031JQP9_9SPHN|nr:MULTISPECIES: DUF2252 family protein [Novosphingobium]AOR79650.1 hypothetical protein BES08_22945 [Novosphingobium resinovorum]EZP79250.1 hypothetical protein BV97_04139 [Novosphingobium resinovorum]MBF7013400.1 DUF2252 family protein [Novosphingobium sp. HR1a]